jgi:hypothetical protein
MFLRAAILLFCLSLPLASKAEDKPKWQIEAEQEAAPRAPVYNPTGENSHTYSPGEESSPEDENVPANSNLDDPNQKYYNQEEIREQAPNFGVPEGETQPGEIPPESTEQALPPEPQLPKWVETSQGSVKVLNKVYTRNQEIKLKKGEEAKVGALRIKIEKCFRQPESDKKESSALLLISEVFTSQPTKEIFHGWMFSSSPAISALEHPLYDVILLSCEDEQKKETPEVKKDEPNKTAKPGNKEKQKTAD